MSAGGGPWAAGDLASAVGWTLLHSFRQAAILWAALAIFRRRVSDPRVRGWAADAAIVLLLLAQAATLWLCITRPAGLPISLRAASPLELDPRGFFVRPPPPSSGWTGSVVASLDPLMPWLVATWALLCLARLTFHARAASLAGRALSLAPELPQPLLDSCRALAARLGVARVRFVEAALGEGPGTLGWLRPCIFVPPAVLCSMTPAQVEAIVAHELAHILRSDYASSALRLLVETLFAANPFVGRIVANANADAEACCDRVALRHVPDPLAYAHTLTSLAERQLADRVALRATGGRLKDRVLAILNPPAPVRSRAIWGRAGGSAMVAGVTLLLLSAAASDAADREREFRWLEQRSLCEAVAEILQLPPARTSLEGDRLTSDEIVKRVEEATAAIRHDPRAATRLRETLAMATADGSFRSTVRVARACVDPRVLNSLEVDNISRQKLVHAAAFDNERSDALMKAFEALRDHTHPNDAALRHFLGQLSRSPICQTSVGLALRQASERESVNSWRRAIANYSGARMPELIDAIQLDKRFGATKTLDESKIDIRRVPKTVRKANGATPQSLP